MSISTIEEFCRWKRRKIAQPMKVCNKHMYPNLLTLLRMRAIFSVTSCECDGSVTVLKILNTYLRASMEQTRLTALAFLHANHEASIDAEESLMFSEVKDKNT